MEFKDSEKKYWNSFYSNNIEDYFNGRDFSYHDNFKTPLNKLPVDSKILELGCGIRADGIELAIKGKIVYETDISQVAVDNAKKKYEDLGIKQKGIFLACDAENLPFDDNFFDGVFIAAAFHHLPDQLVALKEMRRVVKPEGLVILGVEPNAWPYYTIFIILEPLKFLLRKFNNKKFSSIADDTTTGFTKKQFKKMFKEADLEILSINRVKYLSEYFDSGLRLFNKIFRVNISLSLFFRKILISIDAIFSKIPIINLFNWHWNVIARKSNNKF